MVENQFYFKRYGERSYSQKNVLPKVKLFWYFLVNSGGGESGGKLHRTTPG
jgi:hypothetical protein